jgi:hypothetical protein
MTVADDSQAFGGFNQEDASTSLWVFKKRPVSGQMNPFTAVSVLMSDTLQEQLKALVVDYQRSYTVAAEYNLLSQTSEGGFLSVERIETLFPELQVLIDQPHEEHLVRNVKQLNNAAGYVFRMRFEDQLLYCVKKTSSDWATRKKKGYMNILFKESGLDVIEDPSFSIARLFDFFVIGDHVFMTNKSAFESLLSHKDSYEESYVQLKQEPGFVAAISDMAVIDAFVGNNATQLRRMAVIRARGYYNNPNYLSRLKEVSDTRGWGIQFDNSGRVIPTDRTMRAIMHVLLDHRLRSELSDNQYDVPSTSPVANV